VEEAVCIVYGGRREGDHPREQKCPGPRLELESVFRGILSALIYVFALPIVVAIFVLMAAILNLTQGSLTGAPFPDSY
jgi:hypothetical protein